MYKKIFSIILLTTAIALTCTNADAKIFCKNKDNMETKSLIQQTFERPWGTYTVIDEGKGYLVKTITVKPEQKLSVQRHNHRAEHWIVLEGTAKVIKGDKEMTLKTGESVDIAVKEIEVIDIKLFDINFDGKADLTDLSELSLALIGDKELTKSQQILADVDGDGAVKLADLAKFRQYLSKQIESLA